MSDLVEKHFPYDGPHSAEKLEEAADCLANLVRYLNNATRPGYQTLKHVATIYPILGAMNSTIHGFDQLLEQLNTACQRFVDDPTVYDDRGVRPASDTVKELSSHLVSLKKILGGVTTNLEITHLVASHLGNN